MLKYKLMSDSANTEAQGAWRWPIHTLRTRINVHARLFFLQKRSPYMPLLEPYMINIFLQRFPGHV